MKKSQSLYRVFMPLYVSMFLMGFVLWYSIEKVFMKSIGFDDGSIALVAAMFATVTLLVEVPSGILSDRWSRKGVLMIAGLVLAASSFIGGISTGVGVYVVAALLWGVFDALYSGTYDSMVYDKIVEVTGKSKGYEKYYGRMVSVGGLALVIGSILGGIVASVWSLNAAYFITVPIALISIISLMFFKESRLHRATEAVPVKTQLRAVLTAIRGKGLIRLLLITVVMMAAVKQMSLEFSQLWLIALGLPLLLFGFVYSLSMASWLVGGFFVEYVSKTKVRDWLLVTVLISGLALIFSRDIIITSAALAIIALILLIYMIIYGKYIHDSVGANIRAGVSSAVSSMSKIVFIPMAIIFGYVSDRIDVFAASWIMFAGIMVILITSIRVHSQIQPTKVKHKL